MMNRKTKIDHSAYDLEEVYRPTTALPHNPTTIIKYMAPRTLGLNLSSTSQGSLRNFSVQNAESNFMAPSITTNYGLVSLVQNSPLAVVTPMHIIETEHFMGEHRELSKLNDTLTDNILLCCYYDVYNRSQESHIEWLQGNLSKNSLTIEKMFQTEIETAHQLIEDASRYKPDLKKKLNDIHEATLANDEHYQKLLSKRNATNKELFDYQRKLAQNRAELEFLRGRIQYFNDEISFYTLKNNTLQARQIKLRYELDEEIFSTQVLQMESEVLKNEKITNEDVYLAAMDDIRQTINLSQIVPIQPANNYREQLGLELRRMKAEYEKRFQTYRDELHRKFEIELHRYRMHKLLPTPIEAREHDQNVDQIKREKRDIEQQIRSVREHNYELQSQIDTLEKRILEDRNDTEIMSNSKRNLTLLEQIIRERQNQLHETIQIRTTLKKKIEHYSELMNRYPKSTTDNVEDIEQPKLPTIQEIKVENNQQAQLPSNINKRKIPSLPPKNTPIEETPFEEGTLIRFNDFNVEQDCEELNKCLNSSNIDELAIIRILCNRNVVQRLQIRDTYKNRFGRNLIDVIETEINGNSKTILKILLLSPAERDCFELRRILQETKIDECIFIEIFLNRSNKEIKAIIDSYAKIFKSTLERDIINDQETPSKQIILALLHANRPEVDDIDNDEVLDDARNLFETNSKWRKDGSTFIRLLCDRSNTHLKQVFDAYQQFNGADIEQSIQIDKDPDLSRVLMAIVRLTRSRPRFFAFELKKSLKSSGSNENNLTRIIVSRCEIDMVQIKSEFEKISKRTLFDQIQTDTNGYYKRVLLELLRQRIEPINNDSTFKQLLESTISSKTPRPAVRWKEPISNQSRGKSVSSQDVSKTSQFDRNNQAKVNSLLALNTRPSTIEQQSFAKHSYSNEDDIE